jgi:hypothetical protein
LVCGEEWLTIACTLARCDYQVQILAAPLEEI